MPYNITLVAQGEFSKKLALPHMCGYSHVLTTVVKIQHMKMTILFGLEQIYLVKTNGIPEWECPYMSGKNQTPNNK